MVLPHFIILSGVCGSGKSTIGRKLSQRLNAEFIDGDDYHTPENIKKMSNGVGLSDEDRRGWLEQLSHFGDQPQKQTVLACSALKRSYRKILSGSRSSNECRIFLLISDRTVLEERLQNRTNHYAKLSLLESQFETLEMPNDAEPNVTKIDVSGSVVDETVQKIVDCLK